MFSDFRTRIEIELEAKAFIEVVANAAIGDEYQDPTGKTAGNSQLLV
jgi:hypothetical protein